MVSLPYYTERTGRSRGSNRAMSENDARESDESLDEMLEETFPASDAPANTPETGIGIHPPELPAEPEPPPPRS
jgi:hypothetical protein